MNPDMGRGFRLYPVGKALVDNPSQGFLFLGPKVTGMTEIGAVRWRGTVFWKEGRVQPRLPSGVMPVGDQITVWRA